MIFVSLKFLNKLERGKNHLAIYPFLKKSDPPPKIKESRTYLAFIVKTSKIQHVIENSSSYLTSKKSCQTHIAHVLRKQVLQGLADSITLCHNSLTTVITRAGRVGHQGSPTNDAFQALLQGRPKALLAEAQGVHNDLFLQRKYYQMLVLISVPSFSQGVKSDISNIKI